jgi:hypothetical protein
MLIIRNLLTRDSFMQIAANDWILVKIKEGKFKLSRVLNAKTKTCEYYEHDNVVTHTFKMRDVFANMGKDYDSSVHLNMWLEPYYGSMHVKDIGNVHCFRRVSDKEILLLNRAFVKVRRILDIDNIKLGHLVIELRTRSDGFSEKKPRTSGNTLVLRGFLSSFDYTLNLILYNIGLLVWNNVLTDVDQYNWIRLYTKQCSLSYVSRSDVMLIVSATQNSKSYSEFMSNKEYAKEHKLFHTLYKDWNRSLVGSEQNLFFIFKNKPKYAQSLLLENPVVLTRCKPLYEKRELSSPSDMFASYLVKFWLHSGSIPDIDKYLHTRFTISVFEKEEL